MQNSDTNSLTRERTEIKYLLSPGKAKLVKELAEEKVGSHTYTEGRFITFINTIYLDTKDRSFYRHALENPGDHVKLRAREYYYFNEELIELSSSWDSLFEYSPVIWLELKERKKQSTFKHRIKVPKEMLVPMLAGSECRRELIEANQNVPEFDTAYEILSSYLSERNGKPLVPSSVVNYRRRSFEGGDKTLRITLDAGLSFHRVKSDLLKMKKPMLKENIGPALRSLKDIVLEVKTRSGIPSWLGQATGGIEPVDFSKFRESSRLVLESD